jgi:hypothetical protein
VNLATPRPLGRGFIEVHPEPRLSPHLERWGFAQSDAWITEISSIPPHKAGGLFMLMLRVNGTIYNLEVDPDTP